MHSHAQRAVHSFKDIGPRPTRTTYTNAARGTRQQSSLGGRPSLIRKKDVKSIEHLTTNLIETASRASRPHELKKWTVTKSLRGDEKRLIASLTTIRKPSRAPSIEHASFQESSTIEEDMDEEPDNKGIEPGTFVEIRKYVFFPPLTYVVLMIPCAETKYA